MSKTVLIIWPPVAFGLYPILRVCTSETDPAAIGSCIRPAVVVVLLTALLLFAMRFLVTGLAKRAVIVTAFNILFFNYYALPALVLRLDSLRPISRPLLGNPVFVVVILASAMALLIMVARRSESDFRTANSALGVFGTVLLALAVLQAIMPVVNGSVGQRTEAARQIVTNITRSEIKPSPNLPDVYYIIVDGYARHDVLNDLFEYDNQEFLNFLDELGFFTPGRSHSNYPQTYLSLASSVSLSYLDDLRAVMPASSRDRRPMRYLIQYSSAAEMLQQAGYRYIVTSTFPGTSDSPLADFCLCERAGPNEIENQLIFQTPLAFLRPIQLWQHDAHRRNILGTLDNLVRAAAISGPKFVFAHVLAPHPPFVFRADGKEVTPEVPLLLNDGSHYPFSSEQYVRAYAEQVQFLNSQLQRVILAILAQSSSPPIIILQADHGPGSRLDWENTENTDARERLGIFASYLVPESIRENIPEDMTPINTFRILFNAILGTEFPLEDNHSYLAPWERPYEFILVPFENPDATVEQ